MKKSRLFLLVLLLPVACAQWPAIRVPAGAPPPDPAQCERIFPRGEWQLLHSIEALPPDGRKHSFLGVIQLSAQSRSIHCVMLTVEGWVMLEARYDGTVQVLRAVPPLDRPGLAEGMLHDLLLIFFAPAGPLRQTGFLENGATICRYGLPEGEVEDIRLQPGGQWALQRYTPGGRLARSVHTDPAAGFSASGLPNRLVLQAPGLLGYHMTMTLLEAQPLAGE